MQGDIWVEHGKHVANAKPFLSGSFDHPPRNPVEKLNSGYKAWEYLHWIYGLAPVFLHGILPEPYWRHFCKLVSAIQLLHQYSLSTADVQRINNLLIEFVTEFEELYVQRMPECVHFVCQSIHVLLHFATEVICLGPHAYRIQWPMERVIGYLGQEIRQPSNPYANLSQQCVRQCRINALRAILPGYNKSQCSGVPRGSKDIGGGFILARGKDRSSKSFKDLFGGVEVYEYLCGLDELGHIPSSTLSKERITRWSRLRLPNGQIAHSAFYEEERAARADLRISRMVKVASKH